MMKEPLFTGVCTALATPFRKGQIDEGALRGLIRRQIAAHPRDEARVFAAVRGECTAARMNAWHADVIHVNHLKALCQLFLNPFVRPTGEVTSRTSHAGYNRGGTPTISVSFRKMSRSASA